MQIPSLSGDALIHFAQAVCLLAHDGQERKFGQGAYWRHPFRVARAVSAIVGTDNCDACEKVAAAYLHDVPEDTAVTLGHLRRMGFPPATLALVEAVTKRKSETYAEFVERAIEYGPDAVMLKRCDIEDNLASLPADKEATLRIRWEKALERLRSVQP